MKQGGHFSVCCNKIGAKIMQKTCITSALEHDTACARQLPFPKVHWTPSACVGIGTLWIHGPAKYSAWLSSFSPISRPHTSGAAEQQTAVLCNLKAPEIHLDLWQRADQLGVEKLSNLVKNEGESEDLHTYPKTTLVQAMLIMYVEPSSILCIKKKKNYYHTRKKPPTDNQDF